MQSICILKKKNALPANLNALIRYRTIDKCLSNPFREWTIKDLMEACSLALKENRGIYSGVSERTIREDIRVMRSDILGFNAPISQKQGNYFYEDRSYSIFNVSIKESALLTRVLKFIVELQSELDHPDMDEIIESIDHALNEHKASSDLRSEIEELYDSKEPNIQDFQIFTSNDNLSWSGILNLLSDEP